MPQIFSEAAETLARLALAAGLLAPVAALALALYLSRSPYATGEDRVVAQPVPFSHEHHVGGLGIDCRYCHTGVETSRVAGLPPTTTCMSCHSQLWTQAEMLAPVRESLNSKQPLHWNRVNVLPDYVYFDHSVHVAKGVGCVACHGKVHEMPLMRQAAPLTMGWCLDCHRRPQNALQPPSTEFDTRWQPPPDQDQQGRARMQAQGIDPARLTDCSVCHR